MKRSRNLLIGIVLAAAAGLFALQNGIAPAPGPATQIPTSTETETPTVTAIVDETCGYNWAYHDAPELTRKLEEEVKALNPNARARASLYGEDCVYADGHSTFGVMETDLYMHLTTDDLTDKEALGGWMAQVLPIVAEIPHEEIQGNYGFIEFWFEKNDSEHVIGRMPIQDYLKNGQGKTGAELWQMFFNQP
jgi:hypothetical protein